MATKSKRTKMNKGKKTLIIITAVVLVLVSIYIFGIGTFFCHFALNSKFDMSGPLNSSASSGVEEYPMERVWWNSFTGNEVHLQSADDLTLNAYEFLQKEPADKWAILIHGYKGDAITMSAFARTYYEKGFNVLAPDMRSLGKSEGKYIGMGWLDKEDILLWIDSIISKNSNAEILLHGVSMGGATVMMTTGENLPSNVKVAVEDCGYSSVYDEFAYVCENSLGIPPAIVMPQSILMVNLIAGYDLKEASSIEQLKKSKTPTLFVHGKKDDFVPFFMLEQNYTAHPGPKAKLEVDGAAHANASSHAPELYWNTVFDFIKDYI